MKKTGLTIVIFFILFSSCNEKSTKINVDNKVKISVKDTFPKDILFIGVSGMISPIEALPVYEELIVYIGKKLKRKTKMYFAKNYATMNELVRTNKIPFAFVCSGQYVKCHDNWGMELIAAPKFLGNTSYYSYIIVNKKSNIFKFEQLKDKKFAFTDPESNTGKIVPVHELLMLGYTPENFFSEYIFVGNHDKAIEAVALNLVDGAAVDNLIWEYTNIKDSSNTSKTRIIAKIGPFGIPPFAVNPSVDHELKKNIKNILLSMNNDIEGKKILDKLLIDEFIVVEDTNYNSVREMINVTTK